MSAKVTFTWFATVEQITSMFPLQLDIQIRGWLQFSVLMKLVFSIIHPAFTGRSTHSLAYKYIYRKFG